MEFALILPIFMMIILGMFTGGMAYNRKIAITDAVREGTRYGATLAGAIADQTTWEQAVLDRIVQLAAGEVASTDVCIEFVLVDSSAPDSSCGVADPTGADNEHVVKVSAEREASIDLLLTDIPLTLRSATAARYERSRG